MMSRNIGSKGKATSAGDKTRRPPGTANQAADKSLVDNFSKASIQDLLWDYPPIPAAASSVVGPVGRTAANPTADGPLVDTAADPPVRSMSRTLQQFHRPEAAGPLSVPAWRRTAYPEGRETTDASSSSVRSTSRSTSTTPIQRPDFEPMDKVTKGESNPANNITVEDKLRLGYSWRYKGNVLNAKNKSADIPREESCSLFLTNLPKGTTVATLLNHICEFAPIGKIYATHVSDADAVLGYQHAAAKVIMFTRAGAQRLLNLCNDNQLVIGGNVIRGVWNRILSPEFAGDAHLSRVLQITGPQEVVNLERLEALFRSKFDYELQSVFFVSEVDDTRVMEWQFGSYRAQAEVAKLILKREWPGLVIRFGTDPCAVPAQ
ncbi:hypothetical protein B0T22DRAFT_492216 [Podospora appendiculata]|uniref:RRM domain-containing protein n=1 Tax=Podospora appendiculata TaxID=314037 RepID=A0AAE1CA90_9PEZI|nr:hypothetical protein B0T22DRAFT_492216 [Podospora appendiculata]